MALSLTGLARDIGRRLFDDDENAATGIKQLIEDPKITHVAQKIRMRLR